MAITCVIWSLYVLIDRTAEEMHTGELEWPFWTKLIVVAIGFIGGVVFMYVQCKVYVQICRRWRGFNRIIYVQNVPEKTPLPVADQFEDAEAFLPNRIPQPSSISSMSLLQSERGAKEEQPHSEKQTLNIFGVPLGKSPERNSHCLLPDRSSLLGSPPEFEATSIERHMSLPQCGSSPGTNSIPKCHSLSKLNSIISLSADLIKPAEPQGAVGGVTLEPKVILVSERWDNTVGKPNSVETIEVHPECV